MSIEAMKQALEALESIRPQNMTPLIHPAKTTLRTAIEEAEKQEPVAYKPPAKWTDAEIKDGYRGIRWVTADGVYGRPTEEDVARYLGYTRPAAQPAPVQEPESFEQWNAKQHGDPEEIGFLQALRIAYCAGQDSVTKTTPPAAPDLLDALENVMYWDNGKPEWEAARAAIAKATGATC